MIEVSGMRKAYGPVVAVDDVSFSVRRGEIFGVLGPNGAGKTTTVESIAACGVPMRAPLGCSASIPTATVAAFANA